MIFFKQKKDILKLIYQKNFYQRLVIFLVSCFFLTLIYNMLIVPNDLVIGGMSGLAIVINKFTGLSPIAFLYMTTAILLVVAFIFLDRSHVYYTVFGSITFTLMVSLTAPIAKCINLNIDSNIIMILVISVVNGVCGGLVYRAGFNTGGADIISTIVNKYFKIPMGKSCNIVNGIIVILGAFAFGLRHTIYASFIIIIGNKLVDMVMLGINDSKMCFVKSKHADEIENYLTKHLNMGVTELTSRGGIFIKKQPTLLVIVPFDLYYGFKHLILDIDEHAFILTQDCYAVTGGYKKHIIPF